MRLSSVLPYGTCGIGVGKKKENLRIFAIKPSCSVLADLCAGLRWIPSDLSKDPAGLTISLYLLLAKLTISSVYLLPWEQSAQQAILS